MDYIILGHHFDPEMLGFIPSFLNEDDPRPAREQLDANYQHGGGWRPQDGWVLMGSVITPSIKYPGDPALKPMAMTSLHGDEHIFFYKYALVMIMQKDGSFEVARMN